jgi:hypothetical protein
LTPFRPHIRVFYQWLIANEKGYKKIYAKNLEFEQAAAMRDEFKFFKENTFLKY